MDSEPAADEAPPTAATTSDDYYAADAASAPMPETTGFMRPLLSPEGELTDWVECLNDDGDRYYCNMATGETTWDAPSGLVPPSAHGGDGLSARGEQTLLGPPTSLSSASRPTTAANENDPNTEADVNSAIASASSSATPTTAAMPTMQLVRRVLDGSVRRLDPHTQLQLEEARRRHRELEALRDEEIGIGGEHWVEMYDPTHDGFYYYGVHSGDLRWDRPESYVMNVESDDVLRMIVRLQCAFRMRLARRRVYQLKLQRRRSHIRGAASEGAALAVTGESLARDTDSEPWVEVYDPFHKVLYYHCAATGETRWDPPAQFISAAEDREMAAAIAIQSMSRSHLARREVRRRRATVRKRQQDLAQEETRRLRESRRREYAAKTDAEREGISRRELLEEEMEQIRDGDLFWGLDRRDQEIRRQRVEERLLADAEAFWQRVNATLRLRCERELQRTREEETARRERELLDEARERDALANAEAEQCALGDCFWGIQAEERREARARRELAEEEARSRVDGRRTFLEEQHRVWTREAEEETVRARKNKVLQEKRHQRQYFKWFYQHCTSAEDVLDYTWPTHQRFVDRGNNQQQHEPATSPTSPTRSPTKAHDSVTKKTKSTAAAALAMLKKAAKPASPVRCAYVLDDLVLRDRLETEYRFDGKSIYTIHDPNGARVLGRRGRYDISHLDTEPVFAAAAAKAERKPRATSPTRPMPASSKAIPKDEDDHESERIKYGAFPALYHHQHHRLAAPDPHLPARYNNVPFRSEQLSPTREILLGQHTKLTQLPSLQQPQPSSTKRLAKPAKSSKKHSSFMLALQQSNNQTQEPLSNSMAFASPFRRTTGPLAGGGGTGASAPAESDEARRVRAAAERAQRRRRKLARRFAREELPAVAAVFETMDADDSGTINKREMVWALQRDGEVHALARDSALLRLLLKQQSHLEELFRHLRMGDGRREEISWDIFRIFCEEMYIRLMEQGLLPVEPPRQQAATVTTAPPGGSTKKQQVSNRGGRDNDASRSNGHARGGGGDAEGEGFEEQREEALIREVFRRCDADGNGRLEIDELQRALYTSPDPAVQGLVRASRALQPVLHQQTFVEAFRKFEPLDPRGISEEEFVVLCLEIAEIARLNGML